jgi:hypothetical protein
MGTTENTVQLPGDLYEQLAALATERSVSVGHLVRVACEEQYGFPSKERRRQAARQLGEMSLPVGTVEAMKRQSVAGPDS